MEKERKPAVAGSFYTPDRKKLREEVEHYIAEAQVDNKISEDAVAYVAPHAGYRYSGHVAGYTYKALSKRKDLDWIETFVMIGPNHTGRGAAIAVSGIGWDTPLGKVSNDLEFAKELLSGGNEITMDEEAHIAEHSVEVQLPFLQSVVERPRCCFICMGDQSYDASVMLSSAIFEAAKKTERKIAVIASSDFDHYEREEVAEKKDMAAISELESLDARGFHDSIEENDDGACGYGPITVAALYAEMNKAKKGKLLKYSNSGEATGDYESVVAYASLIFF